MPSEDLQGYRDALTLVRRVLLGMEAVERGRGSLTKQELVEYRALASTTIYDALTTLNLALSGMPKSPDRQAVEDLIHNGTKYRLKLGDDVGTTLVLRKDGFVGLDFEAPLSEDTRFRWMQLNTPATHPSEDMMPSGEELFRMTDQDAN